MESCCFLTLDFERAWRVVAGMSADREHTCHIVKVVSCIVLGSCLQTRPGQRTALCRLRSGVLRGRKAHARSIGSIVAIPRVSDKQQRGRVSCNFGRNEPRKEDKASQRKQGVCTESLRRGSESDRLRVGLQIVAVEAIAF